jgi:hypothetical protein
MLAAHEERFRRIYSDSLDRPGGDYGELLQRGEVTSPEGVDPDAWREEIRRKSRKDKLRVTTRRHGQRAFATLTRTIPHDPDEVMRRYLLPVAELWDLADSSRALGHEPVGWTRHGGEYISWCQHCGGRIYTRLGAQLIKDGEALTDPCPSGRS